MHLPYLQVLTMVLPLLLIMVLPKLMNAADPEAQKVKRKSQWKLCCCKNNQGCILQKNLWWIGKYFKDCSLSDVSTVQYQWHIVSHHFYFAYFSCKVSYWFVLRNKSYLPFLIWTEFLLVAQWKMKTFFSFYH